MRRGAEELIGEKQHHSKFFLEVLLRTSAVLGVSAVRGNRPDGLYTLLSGPECLRAEKVRARDGPHGVSRVILPDDRRLGGQATPEGLAILTLQVIHIMRRSFVRAIGASSLLALALVSGDAVSARAQGVAAQSGAARSAATVTSGQFGALRWLNGDWRGSMPDGKAFHERYRFANDSTIVVSYFEDDSTFAHSTGTDSIALRGGVVKHGASTLTRVNDAGLAFADLSKSDGGFEFTRLPGGSWTATIRSVGPNGPRRIVYHMHRVR
jgi:hypothetical protein